MTAYLPVLWYVLAAFGLLLFAGFGAAGNLRGALRYVWIWARVVLAMIAVALVIAAAMSGGTP